MLVTARKNKRYAVKHSSMAEIEGKTTKRGEKKEEGGRIDRVVLNSYGERTSGGLLECKKTKRPLSGQGDRRLGSCSCTTLWRSLVVKSSKFELPRKKSIGENGKGQLALTVKQTSAARRW